MIHRGALEFMIRARCWICLIGYTLYEGLACAELVRLKQTVELWTVAVPMNMRVSVRPWKDA